MKLSELNPKELNSGYIQFDCPAGHPRRIIVPTDKSIVANAWERSGEFPDSLTLTPSILAHSGSPTNDPEGPEAWEAAAKCGWHGFITNGEVTTC